MGFLDKAKQAAQQAAAAAKKGTEQVQHKVEHAQTKKKADELAQQLGYLIVREQTEGTPAAEDSARLVAEITALQAQLAAAEAPSAEITPAVTAGQADAGAASAVPAPPPATASEPAAGDPKLD